MKIFQSLTQLATTGIVATGTSSGVIDTTTAGSVAIACKITVDTNAAGTFSAASLSANHVTITAHGYKTGIVGQVTTVGVLPTGLSLATNYFIIVIDANTVSFATSQANAIAGTAIAISGGTGNSTFTPTALSGGSVQPQWSLDQIVWINIGSSTAITAALSFGVTVDRPAYRYIQLSFAITAGSLTIATNVEVNKD